MTIRNTNNHKSNEFAYYTLKLKAYLTEHFPEMMSDTVFISSRADLGLTAYCDAVQQGYNHLEAESIASETLYQGLHFSKFETIVSILENEFETELPSPLPQRLAPLILKNKAIQEVFEKYDLTDEFASTNEYEELYTELVGTIVIMIEENHLPTIGCCK